MATNQELVDYIRRAAIARNIDPDTALRVARGEGGLNDPFRHGAGPAPKSQLSSYGKTENSIGPFQLYISGTGAGLGDRALAAGVDPRKDWKGGIDFALDEVVRKGWGQWYGAKAAGITGKMGVGENAKPLGVSLASTPLGENIVPGSGQFTTAMNTQLNEADPGIYGNPATLTASTTGGFPPAPTSNAAPSDATGNSFLGKLKEAIGGDAFKGVQKAAGSREGDTGALQPTGLGASVAASDAARMQAGQALMATLLAGRKRRGMTLNTPPLSMMG